MGLVADIFLIAAALGATFYCFVLSRRLSRFTDLEMGVGGAIATMSSQVDDMTRTLKSAQGAATASATSLGQLTGRAEDAAGRLELLVASMHDLPPIPKPARPDTAVPSKQAEPRDTHAVSDPAPVNSDPPVAAFASRRGVEEAAE